jgi:DNA helicase-2/ATP-dependent DNA helicase PcrA
MGGNRCMLSAGILIRLGAIDAVAEVPVRPACAAEFGHVAYHGRRRYDDFNKRRKDLEMFQQITERYRSLGTLLTDLALEPATESVTDITPTGTDDEKLVLSTIHSAKGLEWHSVFVIYALEGRFPTSRAATSEESMEEERRLMYVACTRAQQNLFITYPINIYDRESGLVLSKPSRFIAGLPENLLDTWVIDEE